MKVFIKVDSPNTCGEPLELWVESEDEHEVTLLNLLEERMKSGFSLCVRNNYLPLFRCTYEKEVVPRI